MSDAREIASVVQKYFGIMKAPYDDATREFLGRCRCESVAVNNKSYKYYRRGEGPTIVLVHGLHSNLGSMVPIALDLIEQNFSVVLFDAPAHGEAVGVQTNPVEVREVIRKISGQLGELHAIVCHSLGGLWAFCAWNEAFNAKTLVAIASPASQRFLVEKFVELHQVKPEIADGLAKQLERRFGETLWVDFSPSEIVKGIDIPGLIIHGKKDDFVPPAHAEQLHSSWSRARVEMVEDAGHFDIPASAKVRQLVTTYLREFQ
ncbi:MAG: alpha/beta hydrolase [Ramlibacter sp.]|nr:alpha/beta hydrolase [Ramlibacter sp.]